MERHRGFYSRETKVVRNTDWICTKPFRIRVKLQTVVNCGCHRAHTRSMFALLAYMTPTQITMRETALFHDSTTLWTCVKRSFTRMEWRACEACIET